MTPKEKAKEQILELIKKEKERFNVNEYNMFRQFFMSNGDKRWYAGVIFALEELENLIETEIKESL